MMPGLDTREGFLFAAAAFLEAHGVENFRAYELADVGRVATRGGKVVHAPHGAPITLQAPPARMWTNALRLIEVLEWLRDGHPMHVHSWFRDPVYNVAIGSDASNSVHTILGAADVDHGDYRQPHEVVQRLMDYRHASRLGIGQYRTFVHIDVRGYLGRPAPARWAGPGITFGEAPR